MSRRSVAVAEFGYMDKTQKDFGRPARLAFGEDRFVRFAYFLFLHYFPCILNRLPKREKFCAKFC